jgi:hypothetical protein
MPKISTRLSEKEVKQAVAYWVHKGCPQLDVKSYVSIDVDRPANASQFDQGQGVTATVSFE